MGSVCTKPVKENKKLIDPTIVHFRYEIGYKIPQQKEKTLPEIEKETLIEKLRCGKKVIVMIIMDGSKIEYVDVNIFENFIDTKDGKIKSIKHCMRYHEAHQDLINWVCFGCRAEQVSALLDSYPAQQLDDIDFSKAVQYAADNGNKEVIKLLCNRSKQSLDLSGAVFRACFNNDGETLRVLESVGADLNSKYIRQQFAVNKIKN